MLGKLARSYWEETRKKLDDIYESQQESIEKAARLIAETLSGGGRLHLWDTGHTIGTEAVNRAGGLMAMTPLTFDLDIVNEIAYAPIVPKEPELTEEHIRGFVGYTLAHSNVKRGDVLIIGSVTGARSIVIEMALQAQVLGVKLVGITSMNYATWVNAKHSTGKKLYELCDVVIDNICEVGDAIVDVPGMNGKICPTTGITAALIVWLLCAQVVENMLDQGEKPDVFLSMNLPGATERNQSVVQDQFK